MSFALDPTLVAAWGCAGAAPDVFVQIDIDGATSHKFCSTQGTQVADAIVNVHSITPLSPKINPVTRRMQRSGMSITFVDDGVLRAIASANRMRHRRITVKLGDISVLEAAYSPYYKGIITEVLPKPGGVDIRVDDAFKIPEEFEHAGTMYGKHPLQIIEQLLVDSGVPAEFIDSPAFDPSAAVYSSISHFNMDFQPATFSEGVEVTGRPDLFPGLLNGPREDFHYNASNTFTAIQKIAEMLIGSVYVNEEGKVTFSFYDEAAAVSASWTDDDIEKPIDQRTAYKNIFNELIVRSGKELGENPWLGAILRKDATSQTDFAFPDGSPYVSQLKRGFGYLRQTAANYGADISPSAVDRYTISATDTAMWVSSNYTHAMCGMRDSRPPAGQPADAKISAARTFFFQVENEIISTTTAFNIFAFSNVVFAGANPDGTYTGTTEELSNLIQMTGLSRGLFGTTASEHPDPFVTTVDGAIPVKDVTIAVSYAERMLQRFSNGAPEIVVRTGLEFLGLQLGDLIELTDDLFLAFGFDGTTAGTKFEIVGKQVDPLAKNPGVTWNLAYAPTTPKTLVDTLGGGNIWIGDPTGGFGQTITKPIVLGGFNIVHTPPSTTITIERGAVSNGTKTRYIEGVTIALDDLLKDQYIYADYDSGALIVVQEAVDIDPLGSGSFVPLHRLRSDGAGDITDIESLRPRAQTTQGQHFEHDSKQGQLLPNSDFGDQGFPHIAPDGWGIIPGKGTFQSDIKMLRNNPLSGRQSMQLTGTTQGKVQSARRPVPSLTQQSELNPWTGQPTYKTSYWVHSDTVGSAYAVDINRYDRQKEFIATSPVSTGVTTVADTWQYRRHYQNISDPDMRFGTLLMTKTGAANYNMNFESMDLRVARPYFMLHQSPGTPQSLKKNKLTMLEFDTPERVHSIPQTALKLTNPDNGVFAVPYDGMWVIGASITVVNSSGGVDDMSLRLYESLPGGGGFVLKRILNGTNKSSGETATMTGTVTDFLFQDAEYAIYIDNNSNRDIDTVQGPATCFWWGMQLD